MYIFSYMYDIYLYMLGVCVHVLRLHVYAGDVCVCAYTCSCIRFTCICWCMFTCIGSMCLYDQAFPM